MSPQASGVEFSRVIRFLERRYPGFAETAYGEFIAHVEPDFNGLSYEHAERFHELALEWVIFDRLLESGLSGVELYCEENSDKRGNDNLSQLREAVTCMSTIGFARVQSGERAAVEVRDVLQPCGA